MTDETKTIEDLTSKAKAALLEAITEAAPKANGAAEPLELLARAYATVAGSGPRKGELND
ncbi:hypothetical protein [Arthrobacter sp. B10-11]|uniref:hypothetical protein n=1 Tax=Arthrobacter sp. B10-11 TaxID=3081160 RepID=UPI002954502B|nr:hypothetical protein [Arthrobacter sp. B10-11]MDV8147255.1 hypothetical protein [Arthrobacter sp. B10-11]